MFRHKMSIGFSRNRAWLFYENLIGAAPEDLINMRKEFKNHILTTNEAVQLKELLNKDAVDFFIMGFWVFQKELTLFFRKGFLGQQLSYIMLFIILFVQHLRQKK